MIVWITFRIKEVFDWMCPFFVNEPNFIVCMVLFSKGKFIFGNIKTASQGFIEKGCAMVPLRGIATALGCDFIKWNDNEKSVFFGDNNNKIKVYVEDYNASVNNNKTQMQQPVMLITEPIRTFPS